MVTAVSGFIEHVGSMIKVGSLKLDGIVRDNNCVLAFLLYSFASICWLLSSSELDKSQLMDAYELVYVG